MKKQLTDYVRNLGGQCQYCGKWPQSLYVSGNNADAIISALYKRFGRHTQVTFINKDRKFERPLF